MPERKSYPRCFDPYLLYAISTGFKNFKFFDDKENNKLFFLVEFKKAGQVDTFAEKMNAARFPVEIGPTDDDIQYLTLRSGVDAVVDAVVDSVPFGLWEEYVSRVELSLPVRPSAEPHLAAKKTLERRWTWGSNPPGSLLIGLLDDGCPFAAAHFVKVLANGDVSTRVRGIWDQDQCRRPVTISGRNFGAKLSDFEYGLEYLRDPPDPPPQIGLDEWIKFHSTPSSIDEDSCYADADFKSLSSRRSHGAHVMDVFAGRLPISSRISKDRRNPPSWKPGTDPATSADMVFVQFSEDCLRDATGVWLKAYVVDGIRYILSFADPVKTEHVIINLSYGPTTGPHDGTAELELALTAFVKHFNGVNRKPRLEILLAAGNAYSSEGHVVFTGNSEQPEHVRWTWRLPPDNSVLCFAEVWMDDADADGVTVNLRSPSGHFSETSPLTPSGFTLPTPGGTSPQVIGPIIWGKNRMWLLEVGPTAAGAAANEHGDWTITVDGIPENAKVHAYVARSDPNMGKRTGAKRSYFVDAEWEQTRSAAASCTRVDGEFDKTGSLVCRGGTLNGIATDKKRRVRVAGGYVLSGRRKSSYSSQGPARDDLRVGPDLALLCDESHALRGIRAGGNRSGGVFRLAGTSAAAPQLGRHVVRLVSGWPFPTPTEVPSPNDAVEIEKRGGGNLPPP